MDQRSKVMPRCDLVELRAAAREPPRTRAELVARADARKRRIVRDGLLSATDLAARAASIKRRLVRDGALPARVHRSPSHAELAQQESERRREVAAVIDHLNAVAGQW